MSKIDVGSEVEADCTKCKLVLDHPGVTMQGATPRRVTCNTCNGEHNYRAEKPVSKSAAAKDPAAKKEKAPRKTPAKKARQTWEEVMQEASTKPHKKYSMSGNFAEGDWIEHATFGRGCVQAFVPPNKITVRFADSTRLLVCNQG
jgi:hypothetical protein